MPRLENLRLEEILVSDECRDDEMRPFSLFDQCRAAIQKISKFPPPVALALQSTPQSYFVDHGVGHLIRAQEYADELVDKANIPMNCGEALLLLLSIWSHDVAMLFKLNAQESDKYARDNHHERVVDVLARLQQSGSFPPLPFALGSVVIAITRAHRRLVDISLVRELSRTGSHDIRVRLLAAILRIADASDIDQRRAPEAVFEIYESGIPQESKVYWHKHAMVAGIRYDTLSASVWINILPPAESVRNVVNHLELLHWLKQELEHELESVRGIFREYRVPLFHVQLFDHSSGERLELERPPRTVPYFLIRILQVNLASNALDQLETTLKKYPGNHKVAIEIVTSSGARLFGTVPNLCVEHNDAVADATRATLGDALAGFQFQSIPSEDIRQVSK